MLSTLWTAFQARVFVCCVLAGRTWVRKSADLNPRARHIWCMASFAWVCRSLDSFVARDLAWCDKHAFNPMDEGRRIGMSSGLPAAMPEPSCILKEWSGVVLSSLWPKWSKSPKSPNDDMGASFANVVGTRIVSTCFSNVLMSTCKCVRLLSMVWESCKESSDLDVRSLCFIANLIQS